MPLFVNLRHLASTYRVSRSTPPTTACHSTDGAYYSSEHATTNNSTSRQRPLYLTRASAPQSRHSALHQVRTATASITAHAPIVATHPPRSLNRPRPSSAVCTGALVVPTPFGWTTAPCATIHHESWRVCKPFLTRTHSRLDGPRA